MSIGEKIIAEIADKALIGIRYRNGDEPWIWVVTHYWEPNAADQLEALVEQHIRELPAGEVERIRK